MGNQHTLSWTLDPCFGAEPGQMSAFRGRARTSRPGLTTVQRARPRAGAKDPRSSCRRREVGAVRQVTFIERAQSYKLQDSYSSRNKYPLSRKGWEPHGKSLSERDAGYPSLLGGTASRFEGCLGSLSLSTPWGAIARGGGKRSEAKKSYCKWKKAILTDGEERSQVEGRYPYLWRGAIAGRGGDLRWRGAIAGGG